MRKNSIKNTRINQEVQKELSTLILREVKDPRISPLTSVSAVEVAPDLKTAKVYISVMGSDEQKEETLKGLKNASAFLRSRLAHNLNLRNTPELIFRLDDSIEYGMKMDELLASLHLETEEAPASLTEEKTASDTEENA